MYEEEMLDFCHDCPDYDVCVIDPEEFEDECLRFRSTTPVSQFKEEGEK